MATEITIKPGQTVSAISAETFSRACEKLEGWNLTEPLSNGQLEKLPNLLTTLEHSIVPASPRDAATLYARIVEFAEAFGVKITDRQTIIGIYSSALADIPTDLLSLAYDRLIKSWKWQSLPKPADIRIEIEIDLSRRKTQLKRAQVLASRAKAEAKPRPKIIPIPEAKHKMPEPKIKNMPDDGPILLAPASPEQIAEWARQLNVAGFP